MHDLALSNTNIDGDHMGVLIFNTPELVGFQIMFKDVIGEDNMQVCLDFVQGLCDTAEDHPNVTMEGGGQWFFGATDEQALLDLLVDFADDQEYRFDGTLIADEYGGDYAAFHDAVEDPHHPTWEAAAEDALGQAWVMAALPERLYHSQDELLREAYRVRFQGIYTQQQIQDAIDAVKTAPEEDKKPGRVVNTLSVIYH